MHSTIAKKKKKGDKVLESRGRRPGTWGATRGSTVFKTGSTEAKKCIRKKKAGKGKNVARLMKPALRKNLKDKGERRSHTNAGSLKTEVPQTKNC